MTTATTPRASVTETSPSSAGLLTTGVLSQKLGAELIGPGDLVIQRLDTLERASAGALTFIRSGSYATAWAKSGASAALVTRNIEVPGHDPATRALLIVNNADLALNTVLELMAPKPPPARVGVHASAVVDPSAVIAATASIGPGCVIEAGAVVGEGTVLIAQVYLGHQARIGRGCTMHPGVRVLDRCVVGDGCIFHAGVVIGADGFGYRPDPARGVVKIPHIGVVEVHPGVEIGANSCVDRAKFGSTVVGAGSKIDNLVQVGHGVQVGRCCLIAAQTGIGGSAVIGDGAMLGGQVGIPDNLTIGKGARVAAQSGVMYDVPPGEAVFGSPAYDARQAFRDMTVLRKFAADQRDPSKKKRES